MSLFVDFLATFSILGIWPRFVEPKRLKLTKLIWDLQENETHLDNLKIVHISDLHFHQKTSQKFLNKIAKRIEEIRPDLILFTGDFLCYSKLEEPEVLISFLNRLKAPLGSFCSFGNHDYANYATLTRAGIYDLLPPPNPLKGVLCGLRTLCSTQKTGSLCSEKVLAVPLHEQLCALLKTSPFQLLENKTVTLPLGLNISGLGDLALGRCQPAKAFESYDTRFPGLILSHNPDTFPQLNAFPGNWIFSGHTHGEQIHLPWPKWGRKLTQKLARLENSEFTRGLFEVGTKKLYVNRGLGCHKPFRLFSPPEICLIEAKAKK